MKFFFVILFLLHQGFSKIENFNSLHIKDLEINPCDKELYPVIVQNVSLQIGTKPRIKISGSLYTKVDLIGPIKASLSIKRRVLGIWIPVPCEDNMGSCTYDNLCDYGYPPNTTCPQIFIDNNVPCRCPIPKGNYTIMPSISLERKTSIMSGKYKGQVTVTQNNLILSCYNIYFILYENYNSNMYSVIQV